MNDTHKKGAAHIVGISTGGKEPVQWAEIDLTAAFIPGFIALKDYNENRIRYRSVADIRTIVVDRDNHDSINAIQRAMRSNMKD